jgi:ABC-2 type transport system permease protein
MKKYFSVFLVLIILIVGNLISTQLFTRFDFTKENIYTLSDSSKNVVKNIENTLEVKVFLSKRIPPQVNKLKQDLVDALSEYAAIANGKLKITYFDPGDDKEAQIFAQNLAVAPLNLQIFEKDQRQTLKAYVGLAVLREKEEKEENASNSLANYEKWETIPQIVSTENFEFDFTSAIKKVSTSEEMVVGFTTNHDEFPIVDSQQRRDNFQSGIPIRETLSKNFQLKPINLEEVESIDCDVLLIANPQKNLSDKEVKKIQKFIQNGGNVIALLENFDVEMMMGIKRSVDFSNLLSPFGLSLKDSLVEDASLSQASFSQGFFSFSLPYPFWPKSLNLSKENPIVSKLDSISFTWVSPLGISTVEGINIETLASTSTRYLLATQEVVENEAKEGVETPPPQTLPISLDPQQDFNISKNEKETLPLAVIAQKEGEGKILVVGDADFVSNQTGLQTNQIFLLNAIDSFTIGDELISIRSKLISDKPLKEISSSAKNLIRWGNILGIPLLFIAYGIYRRWERKNRKKALMANT